MIDIEISRLVQYGLKTGLIEEADSIYVTNCLMELLEIDNITEVANYETTVEDLEDILSNMLDYAYHKHLIEENTTTDRDIFDTKIMGILVERPSSIQHKFYEKYKVSPKAATDYYYKLCKDSDYIRRYRICQDLKWKSATTYGDIDITINLSKPEKDPRAIAAARDASQNGYPKCLLCKENEGFAGRLNHPARINHRIISVTLDNEHWYLQYSPYVYYKEHCIVLNSNHVPMVINESTFRKLFDFIKQFPHYTVGSNADLPIVGGSILTHEHFQGGNYQFSMEKAPIETEFRVKGYVTVKAGIVKWPMSVIRLSAPDAQRVISLSTHILKKWRAYSDEVCFIYAETEKTLHNTITPIARKCGENYEIDLVLRNNITTKEHPLGVFHPHSNLHHIKKENIGLIEVMGLAVLPSRLMKEMEQLKEAILTGKQIAGIEEIEKHSDWVQEFLPKYDNVNKDNITHILYNEIGKVFVKVLEDAGVYKRDKAGKEGFMRFVEALNDYEVGGFIRNS